MFAVKENQSRLLEAIRGLYDDKAEMKWVEGDYHKTKDEGHRRTEVRQCWTTSDTEYLEYIASLADWSVLQSIAMIEAERQTSEATTVMTP